MDKADKTMRLIRAQQAALASMRQLVRSRFKPKKTAMMSVPRRCERTEDRLRELAQRETGRELERLAGSMRALRKTGHFRIRRHRRRR